MWYNFIGVGASQSIRKRLFKDKLKNLEFPRGKGLNLWAFFALKRPEISVSSNIHAISHEAAP